MTKPVILTFVPWYLPGYKSGGPVRTIVNMVDHLGDELDFRIVTADRDAFDNQPYSDVVVDGWNKVSKAKVFYGSPGSRKLRHLARLINATPHDILYLNSFFNPVFTQYPLIAKRLRMIMKRPTIAAPRGEFSEGALALKRWKKRPFLVAVKALGLYQDLIWQASSEYEKEDIRKVMGSTAERIIVAPDLSVVPDIMCEERQKDKAHDDPLRVCFLSRITPMKNLHYALRVLREVAVPVAFDIYGIVDDGRYWRECQGQISRLPENITVKFHGVIKHEQVVSTMRNYDLFFLPTRGENYGHVISEALAAGVPVLISDQTPWRNLEALGVGWDLPLNAPKKFCEVIEAQARINGEARAAQRRVAINYAKSIAGNERVLASNLALFIDAIGKNL